MRDKNPIDDLFREALFSASVEPPAHLAEAVLGAARRKKRAGLWYQRRYTWLLFLVLVVGATAYQLTKSYTPDASLAGHSLAEKKVPSETRSSYAAAPAQGNGEPESELAGRSVVESSTAAEQATPRSGPAVLRTGSAKNEGAVRYDGADATHHYNRGASTAEQRTSDLAKLDSAQDTESASLSAQAYDHDRHEEPVSLLKPLAHAWNNPSASLLPARPLDHRTAGSDLWVGINTAPYASHYLWSGGPVELNNAMNKAEAWTSTIGIGAMFGRTWRSGGELAAGVEHERSEQAYYHRATVVEQERVVETQLVVLNNTVYYSNTDTVITERPTQRVSEGRDQRTTWRVPIEGAWRTAVGRFVFGARAGVAAEFTRVVSASSLTYDERQSAIYSAPLDQTSIARRYPVNAIGLVGVDLGLLLHERWMVCATPLYMHGLFSISEGGALHASPERTGIRFQLRYMLR